MFNFQLERKLKKLSRHAEPDRAFVAALENKILGQIPRPIRIPAWKFAMGSLTAITLMLSGTGVYAYSSDEVLPDHLLYPLRETVENVEASLAFTPALKASVRLRLAKRRLREQFLVQAKGKAIQPEQTVRFVQSVERAIEAGDALPSAQQARLDRMAARLEAAIVATSGTRPFPVEEQVQKLEQRIQQLPEVRRKEYRKIIEQRIEERIEERKEQIQLQAPIRTRIRQQILPLIEPTRATSTQTTTTTTQLIRPIR
ncbi:MAG: DUF5667 domain-containing protein [Patescibacteria group bacterium]